MDGIDWQNETDDSSIVECVDFAFIFDFILVIMENFNKMSSPVECILFLVTFHVSLDNGEQHNYEFAATFASTVP